VNPAYRYSSTSNDNTYVSNCLCSTVCTFLFGITQGVTIPEEDVENLLDLLCFFNSENPVEPLLSEELFFLREMSTESTKKKRKDWK